MSQNFPDSISLCLMLNPLPQSLKTFKENLII